METRTAKMTFSSRIGNMRRETLADREQQLVVLHQQILLEREALMHTSSSHLQLSTRSAASTASVSPAEASVRNARLLKDIENLDQDLKAELTSVPSPKFVTLQNNYWSMVRSMLPLWEESLSGLSSTISQQRQHLQRHTQQHSASLPQGQRSQPSGREKGKSVTYSRATK